jgi:SAM-dependent methyltransferase
MTAFRSNRWARKVTLAERITTAYAEHGSVALTVAAAYVAVLGATVLTASRWLDVILDRLTFDRRHGVDTAPPGSVLAFLLRRRIRRHWPVPARTVRSILEALRDQIEGSDFVDFGSGKGRAILIASEFPFRRIVGVERDAELVAISQRNVDAYRSTTRQCTDIEGLNIDARDYPIPEADCVLFLHDPGGRQLLAVLAAKVRAACAARQHGLFIVYVSPRHSSVFDSIPGLSRIAPFTANTDYFEIYRHLPVAGAWADADRGFKAA